MAQRISKADRMDAFRRELRRSGGKEVRAYLGRRAWQALQAMTGRRERGPFLEDLVMAELRRRVDAGELPMRLLAD
ncbi:MAG TPA: hypothetical protein VEC14_02650 [Reyranellaceae bacterium]|nr:hypothetical protein [Reyranellaceae bacterium]